MKTPTAALALVATILVACSEEKPAPPAPTPTPAPAPTPASRPPAPEPTRPSVPGPISETRVMLLWDEATQTVHRKMGDLEFPKDADLEKAVSAAHDAWKKNGKPDAPVTIDADVRIPWSEVIKVVNLVKGLGIEKIEFAMGAPPKGERRK